MDILTALDVQRAVPGEAGVALHRSELYFPTPGSDILHRKRVISLGTTLTVSRCRDVIR